MMPDALPRGGAKGVRFQRSPSAHATPAPVAQAQGGLTLGPEEGELDADFLSSWQTKRPHLDRRFILHWYTHAEKVRKDPVLKRVTASCHR
jgi:hypothetical protein